MNSTQLLTNITINKNDCWLWTKARSKSGYGNVWFEGKFWRAHRLFYTFFRGPIPQGKLICHSCDIPYCVNPAHLWVGTDKDNIRDLVRKGHHANKNKLKCPNGHKYGIPNKNGRRICILCARIRKQRIAGKVQRRERRK